MDDETHLTNLRLDNQWMKALAQASPARRDIELVPQDREKSLLQDIQPAFAVSTSFSSIKSGKNNTKERRIRNYNRRLILTNPASTPSEKESDNETKATNYKEAEIKHRHSASNRSLLAPSKKR